MKTTTELQERFSAIHDALHLQGDDVSGYCVGQLTALMWAIGSYSTWTECHIAADEIWGYSRKTRKLLLSVLPIQELRQRHAYVERQIASEEDRQRNAEDLQWTVANTSGAIDALEDERDWLQSMISQLQQEGSTSGA